MSIDLQLLAEQIRTHLRYNQKEAIEALLRQMELGEVPKPTRNQAWKITRDELDPECVGQERAEMMARDLKKDLRSRICADVEEQIEAFAEMVRDNVGLTNPYTFEREVHESIQTHYLTTHTEGIADLMVYITHYGLDLSSFPEIDQLNLRDGDLAPYATAALSQLTIERLHVWMDLQQYEEEEEDEEEEDEEEEDEEEEDEEE